VVPVVCSAALESESESDGAVGSEASTLTTVVIVVVLPTLSVPVST
jgi:hypothetical protein